MFNAHSAPVWLICLVLSLLVVDRARYVVRFGFVYTDADQTTLWYQANDVAHGHFREPCFYGQDYGPALEAWLAVPMLRARVPVWVALPVVTAALGILPFVVLALAAYRSGHRWAAPMMLLVPLALPAEYVIVSSIPRGFVNGLAVAAPAASCWTFGHSRRAFALGATTAILALATNLNASILLLAAGAYALLTHTRNRNFYLYSFIGVAIALPAPLLVWWFYRAHPQRVVYHPKAPFLFTWSTLRDSFLTHGTSTVNFTSLNWSFGHFIPGKNTGWLMLVILPATAALLALLGRFRASIAISAASMFTFASLGIERVHTGTANVFYPGSRMFLALPVLAALWILWMDDGIVARLGRKYRWAPPTFRALLGIVLLAMACTRDTTIITSPAPLIRQTFVPPVDAVVDLVHDARVVADACREHQVDLVLISNAQRSCFNTGGPVLSGMAFDTLFPPFERRTFRVSQENTALHGRVLLYRPSLYQIVQARRQFAGAKLVTDSPELLLIPVAAPGATGMELAKRLGVNYRPSF